MAKLFFVKITEIVELQKFNSHDYGNKILFRELF